MQNANNLQAELRQVETKLTSMEAAITALPRRAPVYQRFTLERTRDYLANQARFLRDLLEAA